MVLDHHAHVQIIRFPTVRGFRGPLRPGKPGPGINHGQSCRVQDQDASAVLLKLARYLYVIF